MGRKLPPVDDAICVETHRLYGCQSVVYFKADFCDGVMHYQATSDAAIVQGLIALILRVYSRRAPDAILAHPPDFFERNRAQRTFIADTQKRSRRYDGGDYG